MKKKKFEWGYLLLLPGLGFVALFLGAAIVMMALQSVGFLNFTGESSFSMEYWKGLFQVNFYDNLIYSLKIAVCASLICIAIVYPLSLIVKNMPWSKTWLSLLKIPMFIPALVVCLIITNVLNYNGILNAVLGGLGLIQEPLVLRNDPWGVGALATQVWKNVPFMLLIVYSSVESVRKDVLDAGRNLGAGRLRLFWEITLPLTMPSALVAVIMTFIKIFNDYTISRVMGPIYPSTLSNLMHKQAYLYNDWHTAACIGCLMMVTAVIFVSLYTWLGNRLAKQLS
ncbi:ABC transporter permease [uncultured Oscillibacter sp.]|uniref:ABC transporter permease n=1 Tax=uncultured Oscillibacter sp. TaxID=876091 RepID=UPI00260AE599|nr:ABC transporter permease subunit [uncultured Oscillibacter sp.]